MYGDRWMPKKSFQPLIWKVPTAYLEGAGIKTNLFMRLKNFLTGIQLRHSKRVHQAAEKASVVISASTNSQQTFKKFFHIDSPLLNETGCYVQDHPLTDKAGKETFDVLWVANNSIVLHIVGGGDNEPYRALAEKLHIERQCKWYGAVSHEEVQHIMQNCDLLLFTSVAEGTPHVVLEAIGNNLPVLCFNTCGQGDAVNEKVGHKIELTHPRQSVTDFAEALNRFEKNRDLLKTCSRNCKERQEELSWDNKAKRMVELYRQILKNDHHQSVETD